MLALVLTCSLAACAAKSAAPMAYDNTASAADNYKTEEASAEMPAEAPAMAESESDWAENSITPQSYDAQSTAANEPAGDAPTESLADKMIYSANLEIQTTEYDAAIAALESSVTAFGGCVEQSNTYGDIRYYDDGTSRVVNRMGLEEDNQNFLLMYSISVNVSGQIASVIAGGLILTLMS